MYVDHGMYGGKLLVRASPLMQDEKPWQHAWAERQRKITEERAHAPRRRCTRRQTLAAWTPDPGRFSFVLGWMQAGAEREKEGDVPAWSSAFFRCMEEARKKTKEKTPRELTPGFGGPSR